MTTLEPSLTAPHGSGGASVADEPAVEQRGIDYIPTAERRGKPTDLFWMWAGRCSTSSTSSTGR